MAPSKLDELLQELQRVGNCSVDRALYQIDPTSLSSLNIPQYFGDSAYTEYHYRDSPYNLLIKTPSQVPQVIDAPMSLQLREVQLSGSYHGRRYVIILNTYDYPTASLYTQDMPEKWEQALQRKLNKVTQKYGLYLSKGILLI